MKAIIFNIQKFSIHDGPGIRTVIFFKGCHLKCRWCSNPESQRFGIEFVFNKDTCIGCKKCVAACTQDSLSFQDGKVTINPQTCTYCNSCMHSCLNGAITFYGKEYSIEDVVNEVMKDKAFYDKSGGGVTLSGGEVFMQSDFVVELCKKLALERIDIAIESSLAVSSNIFEKFIGHVNTWLVDIKHYDEKQYAQGTGGEYSAFFCNLQQLIRDKAHMIIRIPVIPGFNDTPFDAENFARLIISIGIKKVELLPFHQFGEKKYDLLNLPYSMKGISQLDENDLTEFSKIFIDYGIEVQIGG